MVSPRQILLLDGPLQDVVHELAVETWPAPQEVWLPDETRPNVLHGYLIRDGKGYYIRSGQPGDVRCEDE